jgi:hypothetical protein
MNEVTKKQCQKISKEIEVEVNKIMLKHGLGLKMSAIRFGYEYSCKISGVIVKAGQTVRQAEFEKYCELYDLKPEDFGRKFKTTNDNEYKIIGLKPKATKNVIIIECLLSGKEYKCPRGSIKFE